MRLRDAHPPFVFGIDIWTPVDLCFRGNSQKEHNMKRVTTLVFAALLSAALLAGCSGVPAATTAPAQTPSAQPTEQVESPADTTGPDMASLMATLGGTDYEAIASWPEGLPAEVPEFTYGTFQNELSFKMEVQGITAYAMIYKGVAQEDIDAYNQALQANGFAVSSADASGVTTYTGMLQGEDGSMTMVVMMSLGEDIFMVEVMPNIQTAA